MAGRTAGNPWPVVYVPTADGARIAVKRRPVAGRTPVIFLHGLAVHADLWDLPEVQGKGFHYRSLAEMLHESGYDIWLVNLRGHGGPNMLSQPAPGQEDWCVDHFILFDLPGVIEHVLGHTGRKPFVIGASMGAMTLAGYVQGARLLDAGEQRRIVADALLAKRRADQLAGCVFVELPAALRWPQSLYDAQGRLKWGDLLRDFWRTDCDVNYPFELAARWQWLEAIMQSAGGISLDWLGSAPDTQARAALARIPGPLAEALERVQVGALQLGLNLVGVFTGHTHHRAEVFVKGRRYVLDRMKAGVLRQLAKCVRQGAFVSDLGGPDHVYSDHYDLIAVPSLVIVGGRDRIANPEITRDVFYERLAAPDKTLILYENIAHGEFEAAPAASEQVYPVIRSWLAARDKPARTS